jgi:hypothetical protein
VHLRHGIPDPRHERKAAANFVEHGRPRGLEKLRFPEDRQLGAQAALELGAFARQDVFAIERLEALPHPPQFRADRAALRLAGVGGEDEFHREPVELPLHVGRREAAGGERLDRGGERFARRLRMAKPLAVAEHAHPLAVFGDVGEVEEDGERAGDDPGLRRVERLDPCRQCPLGPVHALAAIAGEPTDFGHERRGVRPGLIHDHVIELAVEQADVASKEVVVDQGFPRG